MKHTFAKLTKFKIKKHTEQQHTEKICFNIFID